MGPGPRLAPGNELFRSVRNRLLGGIVAEKGRLMAVPRKKKN
jgi:hypothetical protein